MATDVRKVWTRPLANDDGTTQTLEVIPTPDALKHLKEASEESIKRYDRDLRLLNSNRIILRGLFNNQHFGEKSLDQMMEGLDLVEADIEEHLVVLRDTLKELKRCGY